MNKNNIAILAGIMYLLLILCGIFHLMYVPSQLIDWENHVKTLSLLEQNQSLFKWSLVSGIVAFLAFLFLGLLLFHLLQRVNRLIAGSMLVMVVASVSLSFANMAHKFHVLTFLKRPSYLTGSEEERISMIFLELEKFNNGILLSNIFWGLWLIPFGYLVFKSGFLPRILGVFLMLGSLTYLVEFGGQLFMANYYDTVIPDLASIPSLIGEFGICLWLLVRGRGIEKK